VWGFLALVVVALAAFWPAVTSRSYLDDHLHSAMLAGRWPSPRGILDLYNFIDDGDRATLMDRGVFPWWSSPDLRIRFLRPLSSFLLWVDHRFLPGHVGLHHAHSLLWWVAVVCAAHALYRRALTPRAAWMATVVFALAPSHAIPIAWLANREALVSMAFGVGSLWAAHAWAVEGKGRHLAAIAALFSGALLGGEYGLGFLGYAGAIVLTRPSVPWRRRALLALAFVLPAIAYLGARAWLHCGAQGSGFYLDPLTSPLAFLREAPRRYTTLVVQAWCGLGALTLDIMPTWTRLVAAALLVAGLAVPLARVRAGIAAGSERDPAWLLLGSLVSVVPVLAVAPHPRLLGTCMVGTAACVASLLEASWWPTTEEPRRGGAEWSALVAILLGFAHFVHAPVASWQTGRHFRGFSNYFEENADRIVSEIPDDPNAHVVVLRGLGASFYLPFALEERFGRRARWSILAQGDHVLVLRTGPQTLELVAPPGACVFAGGQDQLYRGEGERFRVGQVVAVRGMRVTVLEMNGARPRRVRVELEEPFDAPHLAWLSENNVGVAPIAPPEAGFGLPLPR
jgi:hypothetical protein